MSKTLFLIPLLLLTVLLAPSTATAQTDAPADSADETEESRVAPPGQAPKLFPKSSVSWEELEVAVDQVVGLPFGGKDRLYRLYVPKSHDGVKKLPLVLVLHGAFGSAAKISKKSGFSRLAEAHGFIVAYPQGTSLARTWNSGHCCGRSYKQQVDDVGFLAEVMKQIRNEYAVDPNRVYMVGESNGGMLAYRYAAERTAELAGIGVVAGTMGGRLPNGEGEWRVPEPAAPIAVVAIHGRDDKRIPYDGNGGKTISATESVHYFAKENLCAPKPQESDRYFGGRVLREWWGGCSLSSNVVFLTLEGFGHDWPNPKTAKALGTEGGQAFDAATIIWNLLRQKRRWQKMNLTPARPATPPPS